MDGLYESFEQIRVDEILADDSFNIRKISGLEEVRIKELSERLASEGQIMPIGVKRFTGQEAAGIRYRLVYGFRRVKAARVIGWQHIMAGVLKENVSEEKAILIHHIENADRVGTSDYELAAGAYLCAKTQSLDRKEYAHRVGLPYMLVCQLLQHYEQLPENVHDDWKNSHPLLTRAALQKLFVLGKESAETEWNRWRETWKEEETVPEALRDGRGRHKRSKAKNRRATMNQLIHLREQVDELPENIQDFASAIVEYAQGARKRIDLVGLWKRTAKGNLHVVASRRTKANA